MSGWMPGDELRLSDADRETASRALGEHFAQGRLDADEHAERHERIWTARTRGEIPPVFADLPGGSPLHPSVPPPPPGTAPGRQPWVAPSRSPRPRRMGLPLPLKFALGLVLAVLVITNWPLIVIALGAVWLLSHKGSRRRTGYGYGPPRTGGCGSRVRA